MNTAAFLALAAALAAQPPPLVTAEDGTAQEGTLQDVDVAALSTGEDTLLAWAQASESLSPLGDDATAAVAPLISPSVIMAPSPGPSVVDVPVDTRRDMRVRVPDVRPALPALAWVAGGVGAAALVTGLGLVLVTSVVRAVWLARPGARLAPSEQLVLDAGLAAGIGALVMVGAAAAVLLATTVTRAALSHVAEAAPGLLVDVQDMASTEGP